MDVPLCPLRGVAAPEWGVVGPGAAWPSGGAEADGTDPDAEAEIDCIAAAATAASREPRAPDKPPKAPREPNAPPKPETGAGNP